MPFCLYKVLYRAGCIARGWRTDVVATSGRAYGGGGDEWRWEEAGAREVGKVHEVGGDEGGSGEGGGGGGGGVVIIIYRYWSRA